MRIDPTCTKKQPIEVRASTSICAYWNNFYNLDIQENIWIRAACRVRLRLYQEVTLCKNIYDILCMSLSEHAISIQHLFACLCYKVLFSDVFYGCKAVDLVYKGIPNNPSDSILSLLTNYQRIEAILWLSKT